MKSIMEESKSLVKCKCGNVMDVVEGSIDYKMKDEEGHLLSKYYNIYSLKP